MMEFSRLKLNGGDDQVDGLRMQREIARDEAGGGRLKKRFGGSGS